MADASESTAASTHPQSPTNIRSKTVRAVGWNTIGTMGSRFISLAVFVILVRQLDKHELGLAQLANLIIAFIQAYAVQGFSEALIQRKTVTKEHLNTAFWLNLLVGGLLTVLTVSMADSIARWCQEPELAPMIRWLSLSFVLYAISSIERTMMMRNLEFSLPSLLMLSSDVVGGAVGVWMALTGHGVWSVVGQFMATRVTQAILFTIWTPWRPGLRVTRQAAWDLYSFGIKILGIRTLDFANQRLPDVLIQAFFGTSVLGLYSVASRLLMSLSQTITAVMGPVIFAAASRIQNDSERVARGFYAGTELLSVLNVPVFFGLAFVGPAAIPFVFGAEKAESVPLAQWLTVSALIQATTLDLSANVLQGMGRPSQTMVVNVVFTVVQLIGFVVARSLGGGVMTFAASTAVSAIVAVPIIIAFVKRSVPISLGAYVLQAARPIIAASAMAPVVIPVTHLLLPISLAAATFVSVGLGAIVYGGVLWLIHPQLARQLFGMVAGAMGKLTGRRAPTPTVEA